MNLSSVRSAARTSVAPGPCTVPKVGRLDPDSTFGLNVFGELSQIARRADDQADRHLHVEDVVQQVGECQRGQRIAAEIEEMRIRLRRAAGQAQQRLGGARQGVDDRSACRPFAQRAQLGQPGRGKFGVQVLESCAVVFLELGPQQLADPRQQAVVFAEWLGLDQEVNGHLVGLQLGEFRCLAQ